VVDATGYQTVGVTWPQSDAAGAALAPQVRTRTDGRWSGWTALSVSDSAPDAGSADAAHAGAARAGTDSLWVGDVDAVQLSVDAAAVASASDIRLAVVGSDDTGSGAGNATPARFTSAVAAVAVPAATRPSIVTRAQWGAAAPTCVMGTAPLVGAVLHHTADSNSYSTQAQAMSLIRNDQRYHMQSRGWCDLGYNFVVDKWGTIYEGRAGSLTSSVIGVHAGGFNTGTVGIAMLGTYGTVTPSAAVVRSVAQIIGWKLQPYGVDPTGSMRYYTGAGENSRYANQWVTLPRVFGHRDVAYTACPGNQGYAALTSIRQLAHGYAGPMFIAPSQSTTSIPIGGSVTVSAPTISTISWQLRVTDTRTGVPMATLTGTAREASGGLSVTWRGTAPSGASVGPGSYRLTLTGKDATNGQTANSWSGVVQVTGSQNPATVAPVALTGDLKFVPITPQRLVDTRPDGQSLGAASRLDFVAAGVGGVPADAKAVALNVTTVGASVNTHLVLWPAGDARPGSSSLNTRSGAITAAAVVIGIGGQGKVSLYNATGSVHVIVDVTGYYATTGDAYGQLATPERVLDTRTDGAIAAGHTRTLQIAGHDGVPADATGVLVNVVSVDARGAGYVSVVPTGADPTRTSTVNHQVGQAVANRANVTLAAGSIDVYVHGAAAGAVIDIVGWYGPSGTLRLTPIEPVRVVDTRATTPLGAGETRLLQIRDGIPGVGAGVIALGTLTATGQTAAATHVTIWQAGQAKPATSDLNTGSGRDQANLAVLQWNDQGEVAAYNDRGSTHIIVDVTAVFG
jgi:hypothetical protein